MTTINNTEVTIDTIATQAKLGEIILSADRRSTKEKPLTDAQRIRRAILPANFWGNLEASAISATGEVTKVQGLTDVLMNGLKAIGSARLKDSLDENPMLRTIALKDYSVVALLAWSEETAASRGALTFDRDAVIEWFPKTKLHATMTAKEANTMNANTISAIEKARARLAALKAAKQAETAAAEATLTAAKSQLTTLTVPANPAMVRRRAVLLRRTERVR